MAPSLLYICIPDERHEVGNVGNKFNYKLKNNYSMDDTICNCNHITKSDIVNAIQQKGYTTVEEIQDALDAGTVCGSCVDDIEEILKFTK
jgi:NAD(P)H-nitrite reductase